jgi:two-component system, chemotaxis family, sensor kinase CheA
MLGPVMKAAGFDVTVCASATEAMRLLGEGAAFDVIVSDIEMPVVNGFEFAEILRRDARFRHTPIIALSALCTPASIERGRQSGFDEYVAKFDRPGLIAALKEITSADYGIAA